MFAMPKPYPREFREDVVRVARNREPGVHLKQIASDFGISESCLTNWLAAADREEGIRPGPAAGELAELREAKKRIRLLEQENEVLRRAAAYLARSSSSRRLSRRERSTVMAFALFLSCERSSAQVTIRPVGL